MVTWARAFTLQLLEPDTTADPHSVRQGIDCQNRHAIARMT